MYTLLRADARALPLADDTVDLVVTSPPYFAMRSYTDGGEHDPGQIGSEATPAEFLNALIACTREMVRVLKPTGSIFVNLGDKYSQRRGQFGPQGATGVRAGVAQAATYGTMRARRSVSHYGVPPKSLLLIPERYRIRCVDELGLIARAVLVWSKPNGLPESVTDRVRRSHEDWVHLTTQGRYYSAVDELREPHQRHWEPGHNGGTRPATARADHLNTNLAESAPHPLGRLPGSVWEIATQPLVVPPELGVDHFAAFPMEWPRRLILGWTPPRWCTACGQGRAPRSIRGTRDAGGAKHRPTRGHVSATGQVDGRRDGREGDRRAVVMSITDYACACTDTSAPSTPSVVLDPFGGTGTTALVADMLGRWGISVDRSADYHRIARWRRNDPRQRGRAAGLGADQVAAIPLLSAEQLPLWPG